MKHRKKPSRTRRHRDAVAAKRKARAFYRMRKSYGADVLPADEAEAMAPWRGCGPAMAFIAVVAAVLWIASALLAPKRAGLEDAIKAEEDKMAALQTNCLETVEAGVDVHQVKEKQT